MYIYICIYPPAPGAGIAIECWTREKDFTYGLPYLGITGIPGLGIAGIPELGIAGIPELGIIPIFRLTISPRLYVFIVFFFSFMNGVEKKKIEDLRPLYLTTQTLRTFSTWSFELGTSYLQNFARSCVKKLRNVELENVGKNNENIEPW